MATWRKSSAESVDDDQLQPLNCDTQSIEKRSSHALVDSSCWVSVWWQCWGTSIPEVVEESTVWRFFTSLRAKAVLTMACFGSGRLCARVQSKLCQWGQSQVRRNKATYVSDKFGFKPLLRNILHETQVRIYLFT